MRTLPIILMLCLTLMLGALAAERATPKKQKPKDMKKAVQIYEAYQKVVQDTAAMVSDGTAQQLAAKHDLQILNVTWEDTGRYKGSSVGPNISDMTIQVQQMDPRTEQFQLTCMPVIRFPNFSDRSADIKPEKFFLLVGNEKGKPLTKVSLRDFLKNPRAYLTDPKSWKGKGASLLAKRDTHVLVSAQACFLPVPKEGIAEFNPVLFNYQSYKGDPAVLTILATREGTSVTIIDNTRDGFQAGMTWGQRLFFNQKGERASLMGTRLSDFTAAQKQGKTAGKEPSVKAAGQKGLNMVLLIQVPLKQKQEMRPMPPACASAGAPCEEKAASRRSDVEEAVIGHGKVEGPFTEIDNLDIKRDDRFPVRVTVQFYKATSNGVVSAKDLSDIGKQIDKVYSNADYVGSLVTEGMTKRPTEYEGPKFQPPGWWEGFWKRHQSNTGMTPGQTLQMLRKIYGPNWTPRNEADMEQKLKELEKRKR